MWHPQKLELQLESLQHQAVVLLCTAITRLNVATGKQNTVGVTAAITRKPLLRIIVMACFNAMFDRKHYGHRQMPSLRRPKDFAFWLSLMEDGSQAIGFPQPLVTYRQVSTSLSAPKYKVGRDTRILYHQHLKLPIWRAGYYFAHYSVRGDLRNYTPRVARVIGLMAPVETVFS